MFSPNASYLPPLTLGVVTDARMAVHSALDESGWITLSSVFHSPAWSVIREQVVDNLVSLLALRIALIVEQERIPVDLVSLVDPLLDLFLRGYFPLGRWRVEDQRGFAVIVA